MDNNEDYSCNETCPYERKKYREVGEDDCDLKCTKNIKKIEYVEYIGPVHISLIEPPGYVYRNTMVETGLLGFSYFLIGSTAMIPIYYAMMFKYYWPMNLHIFLETLGSQIFMPGFFLELNPLDCAGIWLKSKDKRIGSCILNFIAVVFVWIGVVGICFYRENYLTHLTSHSFFGFTGAALCILNMSTSCCVMADEDSAVGKFVQLISVPAYLFLTVSFISGIFQPNIVKWYPEKHMTMCLTAFCISYSGIIIYRPTINYFNIS